MAMVIGLFAPRVWPGLYIAMVLVVIAAVPALSTRLPKVTAGG
jgi:hypothetical protein